MLVDCCTCLSVGMMLSWSKLFPGSESLLSHLLLPYVIFWGVFFARVSLREGKAKAPKSKYGGWIDWKSQYHTYLSAVILLPSYDLFSLLLFFLLVLFFFAFVLFFLMFSLFFSHLLCFSLCFLFFFTFDLSFFLFHLFFFVFDLFFFLFALVSWRLLTCCLGKWLSTAH